MELAVPLPSETKGPISSEELRRQESLEPVPGHPLFVTRDCQIIMVQRRTAHWTRAFKGTHTLLSAVCMSLPPRPPPHGQGGLLRFGTTEAPAAWARGPPSLWDHRGPCHMGEGASSVFGTTEAPAAWARGPPPLWDHRGTRRVSAGASSACAVGAGAKPGLRLSAVVDSESGTVAIHTHSSSGAFPVGQAPGESVSWSAHGHLRQECCAVGGGDQATDQAPETCRPNAAQSVVPGGLRAHTRETASHSLRGGGRPCRKWSRRSASPPNPCPWGGSSSVPARDKRRRRRGEPPP